MSPDDDPRVAFCTAEYPRLVGALTLYTGDRELAVELAQEAFARACRHWRRVQRMRSPGAWVHRVGINLANSAFARRRAERAARQRVGTLADAGAGTLGLPELIEVRTAISALPNRQRTVIVLRYYADLPVRDVAELMHVEAGTVKALTHQAIKNLRTALGELDRQEVPYGE